MLGVHGVQAVCAHVKGRERERSIEERSQAAHNLSQYLPPVPSTDPPLLGLISSPKGPENIHCSTSNTSLRRLSPPKPLVALSPLSSLGG